MGGGEKVHQDQDQDQGRDCSQESQCGILNPTFLQQQQQQQQAQQQQQQQIQQHTLLEKSRKGK